MSKSTCMFLVAAAIGTAGCNQLVGVEDWTSREEPVVADAGDAGNEPTPDADAAFDAASEQAGAEAGDSAVLAEAGLCDAGERRCEGIRLEACTSDGSAWQLVQECVTAALCDPGSGTCKAAECQPGAWRCEGAELQQCDDALATWQPALGCATGALCDSIGGRCRTPVCDVGQHQCDGKKLLACKAGRDGWTLEAVCSGQEVCDGAHGQCGICIAGTWSCEGALLKRCANDGQSEPVVRSCATASECNAGAGRCEPVSCAASAPGAGWNCGVGAGQDCCGGIQVPGGTYLRGNDASHPATVEAFTLDALEVTVGRFRAFVDAGKGSQTSAPAANEGPHPVIAGSGWNTAWNALLVSDSTALRAALVCSGSYSAWTDLPGANEQRPINCVSWYEAFAFCAWDGGRLPTEAEWNYVAAGGEEQRLYPWGTGVDSTRASYACLGDGSSAGVCSLDDLRGVGELLAGNGRWGHADMAGNAAEWVLDNLADYADPCEDCATLSGGDRVLRGGGFDAPLTAVTTIARDHAPSTARARSVGFRCAR